MWRQRIAAWLLLLAPVQGSAASILAQNSPAASNCRDRGCTCVAACHLPKREAPKAGGCHGLHTEAGLLMKPARCPHGEEGLAPGFARPHILPAATATAPTLTAQGLRPSVHGVLFAGFLEIDLPPPRRLS